MYILFVFVVGLIPAVICYILLKNRHKDEPGYPEYRQTCKKALINGLVASVPIFLVDIVLFVISRLVGLRDGNPVVLEAYEAFIMFALVEEAGKLAMFRRVIRKTDYPYSWLDITAIMIIVGTGFEIIESLVMAFTMGPVVSIVRGVTMMHGVFGFIMGYYYGKALRTGKKGYFAAAFVLPYLYHAIYDFTLSDLLSEMLDWIAIIPVSLALLSVVVWIVVIVFFRKRGNDAYYNEPLTTIPQKTGEAGMN